MIFVDSNIPMYIVGGTHPNKGAAVRLVERAVASETPLVTSAEVFQEILHRYAAVGRPDAGAKAWEFLAGLTERILPIAFDDVARARELLTVYRISARDALHIAVMEAADVHDIMTFDAGFDAVPTIKRVL